LSKDQKVHVLGASKWLINKAEVGSESLDYVMMSGQIIARIRHWLRWLEHQRLPPSTLSEYSPLLMRRGFLISVVAATAGFVLGWLVPRQRGAELPTGTADLGAADLGAFYHQWSKPGHGPALGAASDWGRQPPPTKTYPTASRIPLPDPSGWQALSLEQAIAARRSVRDYTAQPLTLDDLSRLLHAAQGITEPRRGFRAAPSAGALYPIELYPVVRDVAGLEPGIYHYAVQEHALEQVQAGDLHSAVMQAGLGQSVLGWAAVCFVLSAIFQRTRTGCTHPPGVLTRRVYSPAKYRERTYRYVLLEAGHIGQNLCLAATGLGLGACTVGAFDDDDLTDTPTLPRNRTS